ncbi:MAG: hypothetical protein AAF945_10760 [Actinomycetota bacterium]
MAEPPIVDAPLFVDTDLLRRAGDLRASAVAALDPGVADAVERRIRELVGVPVRDGVAEPVVAEPVVADDALAVVLDVAEQFVLDVHGITDERFARLSDHFDHAQVVALMFHMALVDGFAKLEQSSGTELPDVARSMEDQP